MKNRGCFARPPYEIRLSSKTRAMFRVFFLSEPQLYWHTAMSAQLPRYLATVMTTPHRTH